MKTSYAVACVVVGLILTPVSNVQAGIVYTSQVVSSVTEEPPGIFNYDFTVINTSAGPQFGDWGGQQNIEVWPSVVDFEIPLDDPAVVQNVQSPGKNWSYEFLSDQDYVARYGEHNPFGSAYVLHWFGPMSYNGTWWSCASRIRAAVRRSREPPFVSPRISLTGNPLTTTAPCGLYGHWDSDITGPD